MIIVTKSLLIEAVNKHVNIILSYGIYDKRDGVFDERD